MPVSIGLDIGSSAVRAAQIATGGRGPATLQRLAEVPFPVGAVREGEIVDPDAVVAALRELWSRHRFSSRKVALGVANQQVFVRQVDLPYLPEAELRRSLQFQAADAIPIPVENAILDFHVLEVVELDDGQRFSRILLVAAQRTMVDSIVDVVTRAKLEPQILDLDAFAILRSLAPESLLAQGEMLVDAGAGVTNVVIHDAGAPRFVRILPGGGQSVTEGLVEALGLDPGEAEAAKAAVVPSHGGTASTTRVAEDVTRIVGEHAGRLVDDLRGSLDFYASQRDAVPVTRIVLTGGASRLPGLRERIAKGLRLPVYPGHPMQELLVAKVGLGPDELLAAEPHVAVAVGLAMGLAQGGRR